MQSARCEDYLDLIRLHLPDFAFSGGQLLESSGQFNTVVRIDDAWIFRFPKSANAAADLERELAILPRLAGLLPLPIPAPEYSVRDPETGRLRFMGYPNLPGETLMLERYAALAQDERRLERIVADLARFLRALHQLPPAHIEAIAQDADAYIEWSRFFQGFREKLFPYMRADARQAVTDDFENALRDAELWRYQACPIHGDFGGGNILVADGRVSGIIDFSFCALGDPAQDLGALLASYGEGFIRRLLRHYPGLGQHAARARFYSRQYALIQALYALRDGDAAEFEDGIAAYR